MSVYSHFVLLKEYFKIHVATAMEYRLTFFLQTFTMIANDGIWLLFWWIFFSKFQSVNGWAYKEMLMLWAVLTFSFGFSHFFFGHVSRMAKSIAEGKLDFYLPLPKDELWHFLISKSSFFYFGDFVFGLVLAIIVIDPVKWPLFLLLCLVSGTILISFTTIVGSLAFFWGNAEETAGTIRMGLLSFASYPLGVFEGMMKVLLFTIVPAGFISSLPVELLTTFDLKWFLISVGAALFFLLLAIFVWKMGIRRYESGSMITVRI